MTTATGTKARALVLDEPAIGELLAATLELRDVVATSDDETALAAARAEPFDLVFVDKPLLGSAVAEVIRTARTRKPGVVLLVLCSHDLEAAEQAALHLGADAVLQKPLAPAEVRAAVQRATAQRPESQLSAPRVLVVDDDQLVLESLRDSLAQFEVTATTSPLEALRILKRQPAEILVTDLMMAELSGARLMRSAQVIRPQLKTIVITGYGSKEAAIGAVRDGAYDFLEKPLTPPVLVQSVERAWRLLQVELEKARLLAELQAANQRLEQEMLERKRLEVELIQSQKLRAVGQLSAGIAHEINTPVQFITDNTTFLKEGFRRLLLRNAEQDALLERARQGTLHRSELERPGAPEAGLGFLATEIPEAIEDSLLGLQRLTGIVQAMRDFAHPGSEEKVHLDLNDAVTNMVTVARNEWKYVAELELKLDRSLPLVPCLPGPVNQALLNIMINAAHAVAEAVGVGPAGRGRITVETRRRGPWAEVRISDTGPGVPEAIRSRIFEPFFTTKPLGKGTGQGLAIAHSVVVNQHGGQLTFETRAGEGTTFIMLLPVDEAARPAASEEAALG